MLSVNLEKDDLLSVLTVAVGAADKKQNQPILSNFLLNFSDNLLKITATDLEIEICASIEVQALGDIVTTVSARKFIDIIRNLEDKAQPQIVFQEKDVIIKSGKSKFKLTTISAKGFPNWDTEASILNCDILRTDLIKLLQSTYFAISQQQDLRTYLNGLLLDFKDSDIFAVSADGHRMAMCRIDNAHKQNMQVIIPRKSIQEILKILTNIDDDNIRLNIAKNSLEICSKQYVFKTKLITAQFPPYMGFFTVKYDKKIIIPKDSFKRALNRMLILAHESAKVVIFKMETGLVTLISNNQNQEESTEILQAETIGEHMEIGVNAAYLLDVLSYLSVDDVQIDLRNSSDSIIISALNDHSYKYLIMPVKL